MMPGVSCSPRPHFTFRTHTLQPGGTAAPAPRQVTGIVIPRKRAPPRQVIHPRNFKRSNPVTEILNNQDRELAAAATRSSTAGRQCPNKSCDRPNVVDGVCRTCGRVADDTNIVSEIQFSETAGGGNVAQGQLIQADQAGPRMYGLKRFGGAMEERERSIREARQMIQGWADQLNLSESLVNQAANVYKLASSANFIQGRTQVMVAAVCLYTACRLNPPCKIMLIDLADMTQINVFRLGRAYKALNKDVPLGTDTLCPVYPEDLMWRFAARLEFLGETNKVAEDAIRLVRRMKQDWMVMGRRPSGICGAALLMAARMNNFRRTVREVVYIVKVTTHTIQCRLDEFNITESGNMTVEDFLTQDFLESSHDPPSFYRKSAEWQDKLAEKKRKRRRKESDVGGEGDESTVIDLEAETDQSTTPVPRTPVRRPSTPDSNVGTATSASNANATNLTLASSVTPEPGQRAITPASSAAPSIPEAAAPTLGQSRDADGFVIPPTPAQQQEPASIDPTDALNDPGSESHLSALAATYQSPEDTTTTTQEQTPPATAEAAAAAAAATKILAKPRLPIDEEWIHDEEDLQAQVSEMINDPNSQEHADAYEKAERRVKLHTRLAQSLRPQKEVSMDEELREDEFADDAEVQNCVLTAEEMALREQMWVTDNDKWLRENQERIFQRKMESQRPKATRRRRKKPRIGEGQLTPASTPGEAAVNAMKERAFSTRINYDAIRSLFDTPGATSAATSKPTSYAGSTAAPSVADAAQNDESDVGDVDDDEEFEEDDEYDENPGAYENDEEEVEMDED
jgi:transcription factor IIIB 90 kDa subunit